MNPDILYHIVNNWIKKLGWIEVNIEVNIVVKFDCVTLHEVIIIWSGIVSQDFDNMFVRDLG